MNGIKRLNFVSLVVLLFVQCIAGSMTAHADSTQGGLIITDNILKDAKLSFKSSTGQTLDKVDKQSIIQVDYNWELPNGHSYKAGAIYTFQLPQELEVYEVITNSPVKFSGTEIGKFSVAMDGSAKVVFNDFIEKNSNIKGTLQILSQVNESSEMTESKEVWVTPIQGGAQLAIPINFNPSGSTITKIGSKDRNYNTQNVTWTIDLNRNLDTINQAVLSDIIDNSGMIPDLSSIVVYNLNSKLDGTFTVGGVTDAVYYTVTPVVGSNDFQIKFNQPIHTAYRVVYNSTIINDGTSYKNTAKLSGDQYIEKSVDSTVTVQRGKPLEKTSSYDPVTQTITWTIKYNYNQKPIAQLEALLKDTFSDSQEYVVNSLNVNSVVIDVYGNQGGSTPYSNFVLTPTSDANAKTNGFNLQFNENINGAFLISYKTKAKDRVFHNETVGNRVRMDNTVTGNVYKTQVITQQILTKNYKSANYNTKKASWQIDFNKDKFTMTNVKLVDTFTNGGMALNENSVVVEDSRGTLVAGTHYTVTKTANGFEIDFNGTISDRITITYDTDFNYDARTNENIKNLPNKGHFSWDYNNNGTIISQSKETTAIFTPDNYTLSNGFKSGTYDATDKRVTWNIGINYNLQTLNKPWVKDEIIGDQELDKTSLKVYRVSLTGGDNGIGALTPMREGTNYTVSWDPSGKSGFEVKFVHSIDEAYLITYDTSLAGKEIKSSYSNIATLYDNDGTTKVNDLTSVPVRVPNGDQYVSKTGVQNGKIIDWTIPINYGQSTVDEAKITDLPSDNQSLIEDSFELLSTTVSADGRVTAGTALTQGIDYDLVFQQNVAGKNEFVLTFKNTIDKPYILKYKSLILAAVGDLVTNQVQFDGENLQTTNTQSRNTITVRLTTGMGTGQGEVGSLDVLKVDKTDQTRVLEGAEFTLIDEQSGVTIKKAITNSSGKIVFDHLLYGDYLLVEGKAPTGYSINTNSTTRVTINKPNDSRIITNEKVIQAVQLTKVDEKNDTVRLAGAIFDLQKDNGSGYTTIDTLTTDLNGQITLNNLEPGEYQFVERVAPTYYVLIDNPIPFTIISNQTAIVSVTHENERGVGSLTVNKQDQADRSILQGAVFELYDSKGLVGTQTTDASGQATFNNLPYGSYTLKETQAPAGYAIDVTTSGTSIVEIVKPITEMTVTNSKLVMSFKLTKLDADNPEQVLQGAVFQLLYKPFAVDPYVIVTGKEALTTDPNGVIAEGDLKEGFYQLIEVSAPAGYVLNNVPIEFTIDKDQTAIREIEVKNSKAPTDPDPTPEVPSEPTDPDPTPEVPSEPTDPDPTPEVPSEPTDPDPTPEVPSEPTDPDPTPEVPSESTDPEPAPEVPSESIDPDPTPEVPSQPIDPDPTPEGPNDDGAPKTPDQTVHVPRDNKTKDPQVTKETADKLPQTSGASNYGLTAAGIALVLFGFGLLLYRKRNKT